MRASQSLHLLSPAPQWRSHQVKLSPRCRLRRSCWRKAFGEDGIVRADIRSVVSADLSGKVTEVRVREGQSVKKGDVLLVLDTADLVAERKRTAADRAAILASWEQTRDQAKQQIAGIEAQRAAYGLRILQKRSMSRLNCSTGL